MANKFYKLNNLPEGIKEEDVKLPVRSTKYSAGYDFFTPVDIILPPNMTKALVFPTGIKMELDEDKYLALHVRSSLGFKHNVRIANITGIIDKDYYNNPSNEGHIMMALINGSDNEVIIEKGQHFAQGIITQYFKTDDDSSTEERIGGIGSTNK